MDATRAAAKLEVWESGLSGDVQAAYKKVKGERKNVRIRITRGVNKLKEFISEGLPSKINAQAGVLKKASEDLEVADSAVWSCMEDDEVIQADVFMGETWSDAAVSALAEADDALNPRTPESRAVSPSPSVASLTPASAPMQAKLPKVVLPKFTGKSPAEYQTFWNS